MISKFVLTSGKVFEPNGNRTPVVQKVIITDVHHSKIKYSIYDIINHITSARNKNVAYTSGSLINNTQNTKINKVAQELGTIINSDTTKNNIIVAHLAYTKGKTKKTTIGIYLVPKDAVISTNHGRNKSAVELKSDYMFEDSLVGIDNNATVLLDTTTGKYHAFKSQDEANMEGAGNDNLEEIGRFPVAMVDGKYQVILPIETFSSVADHKKRMSVKYPNLSLAESKNKKYSVEANLHGKDGFTRRFDVVMDDDDDIVNMSKLNDGKYQVKSQEKYKWLVKNTTMIGDEKVENYFIFNLDDPKINSVEVQSIQGQDVAF